MSRDKEILLKEANHVMTVCNACRYCEGFCAVFPAMELRRTFTEGDMRYFANLCHNCRGCYYACQYAPPHEFDLNIPKTFAELRVQTYKEYTWPSFMGKFLDAQETKAPIVTAFCLLLVFFMTLFGSGAEAMFATHTGEQIFYNVTPYKWLMVSFSAIALAIVLLWTKGVYSFWTSIGAPLSDILDKRAHVQAMKDAFTLRYLGGGGHGCNYPDEAFSNGRRYFHHAVFYGFLSCFAATIFAFAFEHAFNWPHPFSAFSLPVIFGTLGGISICVGAVGLWWLKGKMDSAPTSPFTTGMDRSFVSLVFWVSFSGLLLLFFRSTGVMGFMLTMHLGFVLAFFVLAPYGKMLHMLYRYFALVRNAQEQYRADESEQSAGH